MVDVVALRARPTAVRRAADGAAERPMMGGRVSVHLRDAADPIELERAAERVLDRLDAWAGSLSRFVPDSALTRLNADPARDVAIGPTLTAVLDWGRIAESLTDGLVDIAMLDARLAAEAGRAARPPVVAGRRWSLVRRPHGATVVREPGVRFDLDGVAKGWLADRALAIAPAVTALVDGDGDIAARVAAGDQLLVEVADPRDAGAALATIALRGPEPATDDEPSSRPARFGLATSGTSIHRWVHGTAAAHHLIDPATWRPAETDIVQATVLADTAQAAEVLAKAVVIAGSERAPALLTRPGAIGALFLTTRGEIRATPELLPWLA